VTQRSRSHTIGALGRVAARTSTKDLPKPAALPPREPPPPERGTVAGWLHGAFVDNLALKFLSIVLAITVFLLVNTDRDREITARVGVSYTLPDDKVLVSDRLEELRITIKGPWRRLRKFDERELERVDLDLRHASAGDLRITPDMVHLPSGLQITSISPSSVRVAFDRRVDKIVEVSPQVEGRPVHGYGVAEVKANPATIKVRGAESIVGALTTVRTREIPLDRHSDDFDSDADLLPPDGVELLGPTHASVHVAIAEELVTRKLAGLAVAVRGDDAAKWTVAPGQVDVTLTGALLAVEKAKSTLVPIVRLSPPSTKPAEKSDKADKAREVEVVLEGLPPGIGAKISPERVKITPVR
jgi:YbbR domain-containing protein